MTDTALDRARAVMEAMGGEVNVAVVEARAYNYALRFLRAALSEAAVEELARVICRVWSYEWDGDPDADDQVAPDISDGERPSKALYREAARAIQSHLAEMAEGAK